MRELFSMYISLTEIKILKENFDTMKDNLPFGGKLFVFLENVVPILERSLVYAETSE